MVKQQIGKFKGKHYTIDVHPLGHYRPIEEQTEMNNSVVENVNDFLGRLHYSAGSINPSMLGNLAQQTFSHVVRGGIRTTPVVAKPFKPLPIKKKMEEK